MTDYEQLQAVFTAIGIPYEATTKAEAIYQPYSHLDIEGVEFWFNSHGDFLQLNYDGYDDSLKVLRKDGKVLREDAVVAQNLAREEQIDAARQQAIGEEKERVASIRAQQRAEYRARYPLQEPTYEAMVMRAHGMVTRGEAPTYEQAVDQIAQEDPEWIGMIMYGGIAKISILKEDVPCS